MTALAGAETTTAGRFIRAVLIAAGVPSGKAHPAVAPVGTAMPYVVWQSFPRPDGEDVESLGGGRVMARLRFLVKVIADTQAQAEPMVKQVDSALQVSGIGGPQGDYIISSSRRTQPFELPVSEGQEVYWQIGGYYDINVIGTE